MAENRKHALELTDKYTEGDCFLGLNSVSNDS
jgi:hypothetical protein